MRILEWYPEDWVPESERIGDRRQSNRRPIAFEVLEGRGSQAVRAWTRDVSPTGIQTEAEPLGDYPPESVVPLALHLPGRAQPLRTSAMLIWASGRRAGFEFVAMSDADRLEIAEMVDREERAHGGGDARERASSC